MYHTIQTNNPFFATGVILFLILLGILVVVFVRNRDISENLSTGKTHISYSADIDREIDGEMESHEQGKEGGDNNFQVFICRAVC